MKYTEEEMTALAAELLEVDFGLPQVCEACGSTMKILNKGGE